MAEIETAVEPRAPEDESATNANNGKPSGISPLRAEVTVDEMDSTAALPRGYDIQHPTLSPEAIAREGARQIAARIVGKMEALRDDFNPAELTGLKEKQQVLVAVEMIAMTGLEEFRAIFPSFFKSKAYYIGFELIKRGLGRTVASNIEQFAPGQIGKENMALLLVQYNQTSLLIDFKDGFGALTSIVTSLREQYETAVQKTEETR